MASIPLDQATGLGICIESVLYGVYLVLFATSTRELARRFKFIWSFGGKLSAADRLILFVSVALFALISSHYVVNVVRLKQGFVDSVGTPNGPLIYFGNSSDPLSVFRAFNFGISALLMDTVLVYRVFVIWGRNLLISLLPAACTLAGVVTSCIFAWMLSDLAPTANLADARGTVNWIQANFWLSVFVNLYCTSTISYKLFRESRELRPLGMGTRILPALGILIESAALHSVASMFVAIMLSLKYPGGLTVFEFEPTILGIAFTAIIIRVAHASHDRTIFSASISRPRARRENSIAALTVSGIGQTGDAPGSKTAVQDRSFAKGHDIESLRAA